MGKGVFVTATGTDVGKTYVCALLLKKIKKMGLDCGYFKPVLSGLENRSGILIPGDAEFVLKNAGINSKPMDCVSYAFESAVSPHLAAKLSGTGISIDKIRNDFFKIKSVYDYIIVEGAGGITCPVVLDDSQILMSDIIKTLGLDIIIVAPSGLGSINYTLLTAEYARKCGILIKGFILNRFDCNNFLHVDNLKAIEILTGIDVIATISDNDTEINIDNDILLNIFGET